MAIIEAETIIDREPAVVFSLHSDFRKRSLWHDHVLSSEMLTGPPIGVDSRFRTRNKTGLLTLTTQERIIVFEPPHYYCYELDNSFLHIKSCQRFTAIDDGTHYQLRVEMRARNWLGKILLPSIVRQQRPHFVEAAQELKRYLEDQSSNHSLQE